MPYFRWKGIDLHAQEHRGVLWAQNKQVLDQLLLKRNIALLNACIKTKWMYRPITFAVKALLYERLAVFLKAGMLFPEALDAIASHMEHPYIQDSLIRIAYSIKSGKQLQNILSLYPKIFDPLSYQILCIGYRSGSLYESVHLLALYFEQKNNLYKQIKAAILMPICTLIFFIVIAAVIFLAIIPQFESIFISLGKEIPKITRILLQISSAIRGWYGLLVMGGICFILCILLYSLSRLSIVKKQWDIWILSIPFFGKLIRNQNISMLFYCFFLLSKNGMTTVESLLLIKDMIQNTVLRSSIDHIIQEIRQGAPLNEAFARYQHIWVTQDVVALLSIGQNSDSLNQMIYKIAIIHQDEANRDLQYLTAFIQPLLMLVLGLLVAFLLIAVYVPIFDLPKIM